MANVFVRSGATGANNGTDWTNAYTTLPATLTRGDTYYIADGSYSGYTFNDAVSGTTLITIKKAIVTDHGTEIGWNTAFGDGVAIFTSDINFTTPYWVFDGQVGGGPGSWTSGHGFRLVRGTFNVNQGLSGNAHHITGRHFEVTYNNTTTPAQEDGVTAGLSNDITWSYVYIHDIGNVPIQILNVTNVIFEYSYTGFFPADVDFHAEILSGDGLDNWDMRYNLFTHAKSTGGLIIHTIGSNGVRIYGNVFYRASGEPAWTYGGNGLIGGWTTDNNFVNVKVINNDFVGIDAENVIFGSLPQGSVSGNEIRNNYFYNVSTPLGLPSGHWGTVTHNHFNNSGSPVGSNTSTSSGDPFVNYTGLNFALQAATTAGITLSAPYTTDMLGATRGFDGTWDRGAVEFGVVIILTTSLPNGEVNVAYSQTLAVIGGTAPYTWNVSVGVLPTGLSLSSNGVISGTPTTSETQTFTVRVVDALSMEDTQQLSIVTSQSALAGTILMFVG